MSSKYPDGSSKAVPRNDSRSCQSCCPGGEGIVVAFLKVSSKRELESLASGSLGFRRPTPSKLLAILMKVLRASTDLA